MSRHACRWSLALAVLLPLGLLACDSHATVVGVLEVASTDPMAQTRTGFLEALKDGGYKGGDNARFVRRNAQARKQPLPELATELVKDERAVLTLALTTPALKAALQATPDQPIVFAMSGDPYAAGAGKSEAAHRPNVTGVAAPAPDGDVVALVKRLLPRATRLGILFDPQDDDSVASSRHAQAEAAKAGLTGLLQAASAQSAGSAAQALVRLGAEAVYATPASGLDAAMGEIVRAASVSRVPVIAASAGAVDQGALAAFDLDWKQHGRQAGALALRVLRGESPATIPIQADALYQLSLNQRAAERLGVVLRPEVLVIAKRVVR